MGSLPPINLELNLLAGFPIGPPLTGSGPGVTGLHGKATRIDTHTQTRSAVATRAILADILTNKKKYPLFLADDKLTRYHGREAANKRDDRS